MHPEEYLYAKLERADLWRYRASYFTLMFSEEYRSLIAVHSDDSSTEITSLKCVSD
jgi:hypothetical protein